MRDCQCPPPFVSTDGFCAVCRGAMPQNTVHPPKARMSDDVELKPCRECGAPCSEQVFTGEHIEGEARLWMCSKHHRLGGACPSTLAYLSVEAWNEANRKADDVEVLIERLNARRPVRYRGKVTGSCPINPDGPEAAAALVALRERVKELEGALGGLLAFAEDAETKMLVGDEGCLWPVEFARAALAAQPTETKNG